MKIMITRLENRATDPEAHTWTINDRVNQNHHGWVNFVAPCLMNLYWKEDDGTPDEQFIGTYNLNLEALLDAGYLRTDSKHPNQVFLRFQRSDDNKVQIALNKSSQAIDCGIVIKS